MEFCKKKIDAFVMKRSPRKAVLVKNVLTFGILQ